EHAEQGTDQKQRRVAKLRIGAACHHTPYSGDPLIGADAPRRARLAEPDAPAFCPAFPLDEAGQGAVVDERAANPFDSARPLKCLAADEHASSGGGRGRIPGIVDACERVELAKEEDEGRDQQPFPEGAARKLDHERGQVEVVSTSLRDQAPENCRRGNDIGVGEPEPRCLRLRRSCSLDAPLERPQLPCPTWRRCRGANNVQAIGFVARIRRRRGDFGGTVLTAVVDENDVKPPWIVLAQQRQYRGRDDGGLVPRRTYGDDRGPGGRLGRSGRVVQVVPDSPEHPMEQEQPNPGGERQGRQNDKHAGHSVCFRLYAAARSLLRSTATTEVGGNVSWTRSPGSNEVSGGDIAFTVSPLTSTS